MTVTVATTVDLLLANRYARLTLLVPLKFDSDFFPLHETRDDTEREGWNRFAASFDEESAMGIEREHAELASSKRIQPKVCSLHVADMDITIEHSQALVKIGTAATMGPRARTRALKGFMKKELIKLQHLPSGCHDAFRRRFTPLLRQFMGTFPVWENPSERDIVTLWYKAFPYHQSQPSKDFVYTLVKLVRHAVVTHDDAKADHEGWGPHFRVAEQDGSNRHDDCREILQDGRSG
jgi:hypothetical protein